MTTRTVTYKICDSCGCSDLHDSVFEWNTTEVTRYGGAVTKTVDICDDCIENDVFYCRFCHSAHSEQNPCEKLKKIMEEA